MHQVIDKSHNFEFNDNAITWLFTDEMSDDELQGFAKTQSSPHSQIIVSGTKAIGDIDAFAKHLKSAWVYYLPFIFMKDGANFSSFFQADLVMIGEKTADSVGACELLLFCKTSQNLRD